MNNRPPPARNTQDNTPVILHVLPPLDAPEPPRITPTPQQKTAVDRAIGFVHDAFTAIQEGRKPDKLVFSFSGIAGAGKTTCASFIIRGIKEKFPEADIAYLGSTHRARIQLAHYLMDALGQDEEVVTRTVWSAVFYTEARYFCVKTPKNALDQHETVELLSREKACEPCAERGKERCGCPLFTRCSHADKHMHCDVDCDPDPQGTREAYPFGNPDLLYIDEGSMVTEEQMDAIRSWGIPVILSGDHMQLGPVNPGKMPGQDMCREMYTPDAELTEPMRQDPASALYRVTTAYRHGEYVEVRAYDEHVTRLDAADSRIPSVIANFEPGPHRVIITSWHAARSFINRAVHHRYYPGGILRPGERVTALKQGHGYTATWTEWSGMTDIGAHHLHWEGVNRSHREYEAEITRLNRKITAALDRAGIGDERAAGYGSALWAEVTRWRDDISEAAASLRMLPPDRRKATINKGLGWVEAVQDDPDDERTLYALVRLESPFPWSVAAQRVTVRMAREQFGTTKTLTITRTPPRTCLWDYGHCLTAWNAQGGEWDDVIAFGMGWDEVYQRVGYVSASRARMRLLVIGDAESFGADFGRTAGKIARGVYEYVIGHPV